TFDASVIDLFATWGGGATLVVPLAADLYRPVDFVVERELTHWFSVPSVIREAQRLGNLPTGRAVNLRHSMFGAEPVTAQHAELWRAVAPNAVIHNVYGPTELTVCCTNHALSGPAEDWPEFSNGTVPIGVPLPGNETVLLDENGLAADEGELCVRGAQRFGGYLDPRESAGRFVSYEPDGGPAVSYDGSTALTDRHWYRTGALGHVTRTVPAGTAQGLDKAAAEYGAPLSAVLLAAYQVLLGRWTRRSDLAVGVPGPAGGLAVVRADLTTGPAFAELVARTDAALTRGRAAALPVARLAAVFGRAADGHHPVVQALFTDEPAHRAEGDCPPDLTLALDPTAGREGLGLRVDFAAELFDAASAERLMDGYLTLLTAVAEAPGIALEALDPLGAAERELLLDVWGR
ncbi:AMP-binding protein, partial [Streptomyces sp. NPDC058394]|uniref:AMP-binding protein n=1 Tax=Streptomyces sp. NPDC058394 TaxID=3346477 RepID=UPI003656FB3B